MITKVDRAIKEQNKMWAHMPIFSKK